MADLTFRFEGRPVSARRGQSLAAALAAAGHRVLRTTPGGRERGLFCGMGVCQDCLVSVDGVANRRACMILASDGIDVRRQVPHPDMGAAGARPTRGALRTIAPDVLVIGGGAGGLSAAIAARRAGASVIVIDERKRLGGQYYKQASSGPPLDPQQAEGAALVEAAVRSGAEILEGAEIWGAFDGLVFAGTQDGAAFVARPRTAIVAAGAYERPVLVPGWTLPGVMTTGAAQTLWRSDRILPGRRIMVCGSGPLNLQVALELAEGGAEVAMVAERASAPFRRPWAALRMLAAGPRLTAQGIAIYRRLRRRGVPVRDRTELLRVEPAGAGLEAWVRTGNGGETSVEVDSVCMNIGFEPQNELLRLLGAEMHYDAAFGHLRTRRSELMQTSVPGLFAVGDCAGLGGAPAARVEGRIAGHAAAAAAGFGGAADLLAEMRELKRHRFFQACLWRLYDVTPCDVAGLPEATPICRCEDIDLGTLRATMDERPGHAGTLKRSTRAGMGRCQGRYCAPVLARLVAETTGAPLDSRSGFAPRVPVRPTPLAAIQAVQEAFSVPWDNTACPAPLDRA